MKPTDWFSRAENFDLGNARCPRCQGSFHIGSIFDHHRRKCVHCGTVLVEWNVTNPIYVIDYERSPQMVKVMIDYLDQFVEPEAASKLEEFLCFLGVRK